MKTVNSNSDEEDDDFDGGGYSTECRELGVFIFLQKCPCKRIQWTHFYPFLLSSFVPNSQKVWYASEYFMFIIQFECKPQIFLRLS